VTSRALSLLAALASPLFLAAAVAGWVYGVWPATPLTFAIAAAVVAGGPVLGIWHVATADKDYIDADYVEEDPTFVLTPEPARELAPIVDTPRAAAARAFNNWRDKPNDAIARRDRERRANAFIRT
jgi:hypothetical protein